VSTSVLAGVRHFRLPVRLLDETLEVLAAAGQAGHEAFVLLGGRVADDGTSVDVCSTIVPEQTAHRTPRGLLVTVEGSALFRVNRELYERGELLTAQVHSHPTDAFHSDTDDHNALVTLIGSLSLVVPDFAVAGRKGIRDWAWYRLVGEGRWAPLDRRDRIELVHR
jgi:hypothetical protein